MIIIEGPDGAGKTSLMQRLQMSMFQWGITEGHHKGTPNRDRMWETTVERTYDAIGADLDVTKPPLIWDRLFYSELVYAPLMERKNAFGLRSNYVHRLIYYTGSPVILCVPSLEAVIENCAKTKQHSWVVGNEEQIYERYRQISTRYGNETWFVWDYENPEWDALTKHITSYLTKRKATV